MGDRSEALACAGASVTTLLSTVRKVLGVLTGQAGAPRIDTQSRMQHLGLDMVVSLVLQALLLVVHP